MLGGVRKNECRPYMKIGYEIDKLFQNYNNKLIKLRMKQRVQKRKYYQLGAQQKVHSFYKMDLHQKHHKPVEFKKQNDDQIQKSIQVYVQDLLFSESRNCQSLPFGQESPQNPYLCTSKEAPEAQWSQNWQFQFCYQQFCGQQNTEYIPHTYYQPIKQGNLFLSKNPLQLPNLY